MKAVLAKHRCRAFRYLTSGVRENLFDEDTLTIVGSEDEIAAIERIEIGSRKVDIDHVRGTADHGTHIDPMIPVAHGEFSHLQLFLCGYEAADITREVRVQAHGRTIHLRGDVSDEAFVETMTSSVERTDDGWFLKVNAPEGAEIIWQFQASGIEHEIEADHVTGEAEIKLPTRMGNRLGICVTSSEIFGGVEHKHLVFGEVGHPSGRYLWSRGALYAPKLADEFAYRSLIVHYRPGEVLPENLSTYDEIELIVEQKDIDAAVMAMHDLGVDGFITSVSHASRPGPCHGDIVLLAPDEEPVEDEMCSYLLFSNQDDPDWPERLKAAFKAVRSGVRNLIELPWLGASTPALSASQNQYGIAFSVPGRESRKSKVFAAKREKLPQRTPCGTCESYKTCSRVIALPWPERLIPEGNCLIRNSIG